ncbi:hypothetical protein BpHYR1_045961 [Brachionus plicatilis]|uniref:Uncharacterized protein n=1 Tax=Brachionus plicatilis TaxID=10195 RepID=A0A3M7T795_BRAPC|nr:hypothetical protein BpHYR1_045961 [Brachionus plicatilis]
MLFAIDAAFHTIFLSHCSGYLNCATKSKTPVAASVLCNSWFKLTNCSKRLAVPPAPLTPPTPLYRPLKLAELTGDVITK